MAVSRYELDERSDALFDEILYKLRQDCRCVKEIRIIQPVDTVCRCLLVDRIETGIWEWNEEII